MGSSLYLCVCCLLKFWKYLTDFYEELPLSNNLSSEGQSSDNNNNNNNKFACQNRK